MRYLSILECPIVFDGENKYAMTSVDMCPSLGITPGLASRHIRVLDARIMAVCIWEGQAQCEAYFDAEWYAKAAVLWEDGYQLRLEATGEPALQG